MCRTTAFSVRLPSGGQRALFDPVRGDALFSPSPSSTDYRGSRVLLPSAGDGEESLRPLMSWWLVLHALSMFARYAPRRWMHTLSLDDSAIASKVEFLLDAAVDAVSELLLKELQRLPN